MQQLVSLLEREKSESEKLSGELRCENKYLKEELFSLKISTKCCLEQNQKDIQDMAEKFIAEKKLIEHQLTLSDQKIKEVTKENEKLEHESILKESMNSELLEALNQKEKQNKKASEEIKKLKSENLSMFDQLLSNPHEEEIRKQTDELTKVKSENNGFRKEIEHSSAKINQLEDENAKSKREILLLREDIAAKASIVENVREVKMCYRQAARTSKKDLEHLRQQNTKLIDAQQFLEKKQNYQEGKIRKLQAELEKGQIVKSESEEAIEGLKSEIVILTASNEKYATNRIGDFESLRDLEDQLDKVKWQNSKLMEAAEIQNQNCIVESNTVYKEMESERISSLLQFNQTIAEKDELIKSLQQEFEKLKGFLRVERGKLDHLNDQHSNLKRELKECESLKAEKDDLCLQIKEFHDKVGILTEQSNRNETKVKLMETEKENQAERTNLVLKMKSEEVKKLSENNQTITMEKKDLENQLSVLATESKLKVIKIDNLESELALKRKSEIEEKDTASKKNAEMTKEIINLTEENTTVHLKMNTLQKRLNDQRAESENMKKTLELFKSEQTERDNLEKEKLIKTCVKSQNRIKILEEEATYVNLKVDALKDEIVCVKRESALKLFKRMELNELDKSKQRENLLFVVQTKNQEIFEKGKEMKLLRAQKSQMQAYFMHLESQVVERDEEIKALCSRWKDKNREERRVVFRGEAEEKERDQRGEEEGGKRYSRERHAAYEGGKGIKNRLRY